MHGEIYRWYSWTERYPENNRGSPVKTDLRKAYKEETWREKANNGDKWKQITKVAVQRTRWKLDPQSHHAYDQVTTYLRPIFFGIVGKS